VVGFCYWLGKGVANNQAEAERWLRLAALQGHRISQAQVGTIYDRMQNYAEAARFWRLASAQGHGQSTLSLARLYEDGTGVAHDKTEAARLCRLAAEQGVSDSTCLLRLLMLI
jgi:TPR repeat protein